MHTWQLQDAKARFSEVIRNASTEGPQSITIHGKLTAVVLSYEEFEQLAKPKSSFIKFMRQSPLADTPLDIRREQTLTREIDL